MIHITDKQVAELLDYRGVAGALEQAFVDLSQAQALCEVFDFEEACIVDPMADPEWCAQFAASIRGQVRVAAPEEAVRGADIVVTATRSQQPVFDGAWLNPGTFVAAMGNSAPQGREQSLAEAGEIALWNGRHATDKFTDLPELLRADRPWFGSSLDITVFKSVGAGLSDVATAHLAVQRLRAGSAAAVSRAKA